VRIAILGAGAWGSALAVSLSSRHPVSLWGRDVASLERERVSRYLQEVRIPAAVHVTADLSGAVAGADCIIVATATSGLRETTTAIARSPGDAPVLWACKGFETGTAKLPHQVVDETLPRSRRRGALSGPSFALEVARGLPTAVVLASDDAAFAADTAATLNSERMRIYSSDDLAGVELGGALKNVIAIAAGISDGLELGRNARAALITRGLAEITRLGSTMGGQAATFAGLAGLGDLVLTCTGELSRNREVGRRLARGASLDAVLAGLGHVSEGVASARAAMGHARMQAVEMPITEAVCAVLFNGRACRDAVDELLSRGPRAET
jgi:glycerol-3-phosphate dehydrogenase (NAD(P)+)